MDPALRLVGPQPHLPCDQRLPAQPQPQRHDKSQAASKAALAASAAALASRKLGHDKDTAANLSAPPVASPVRRHGFEKSLRFHFSHVNST
jgi:hypothetical protein